MAIIVDGTYFAVTRGANLGSMINGYISKKQQTIQDLYKQKAAIEEMYNNVASGLFTTNSSVYQLNTYYNNQILGKNSTIKTLQAQINVAGNKISALNSMTRSFKSTVTSLDDFLASLRDASNTSSTIDFSNTNEAALGVEIKNTTNVSTQRIEYNIKQIATATKAISNTLNGYNITESTKIKDLFAGTYDSSKITGTRDDLDESITMSQLGISSGYWNIGTVSIDVGAGDTLLSIANKLKAFGYDAGVRDGRFYIDGRNINGMNIHDQASNFCEVVGLTISTGDFKVNGKTVTIDNNTTIQSLKSTINADPGYGVGLVYNDNRLSFIANQTGNVLIEFEKGTSNFTNVMGYTLGGKMITDNLVLGSDGSSQTIKSANTVSSVSGNVSAGQFTITKTVGGVAQKDTITVTQGANLTATLNNIKTAINGSSLNLTAEIKDDRFVIKANELGVGCEIIVEAGDSDFTEKLGFTNPIVYEGTPSFDENTNYFTKLTGITTIANPSSVNITAGSFKINGTTIDLTAGTLQAAINKINTYTNTTGVIAEYNGTNIVLRNKYTGDTNLYVEGGTSNFGSIAGFTTESINTSSATIGQVGSKTTLTGSETVSGTLAIGDSVIKINGRDVNISAGQLSSVVTQLNNDYSDDLDVVFSISAANKLVITEKRNGDLPINVTNVSGNFAQLTGIAGYQSVVGQEEKYGSSRTTYTTSKNVTNATRILDSTVNINGVEILLSGTINDVISTINSYSATTGVEAYINGSNKFTLRNVNTGSTGITFSVLDGDFGRVVGACNYTTTAGSTSHTEQNVATVTGAVTGLDEFTQVLAGSKIQFGTTVIDLGASVGAALLAINLNKDVTGVEAFLNEQGQFVLRATSDANASIPFSVIGVGDFGRVTGLGSYTVGGTSSNGEIVGATYSTLVGSNNVALDTQITGTNITLRYVNSTLGIDVSKTFDLADGTLDDAIKTINDANWYVKAEIVNNKLQFVSRTTGPQTISIAVNATDGVTGDFGRVVGLASSRAAAGSVSHLQKEGATYTGAMTGLNATDELIGTNTITLKMTRTKTNTGVATEGGSGALASVEQSVTFSDKDGDGKITLQDAIDSINDVKSITKIEAALVNGQFVFRQIDANTAGEGDNIVMTHSGDGDFVRVTGFGSYTTIGQSNTGSVSGQSYTTLVGSRNIANTNEVLAGSFTFSIQKAAATNSAAIDITTTINIADGTMANAITAINTQLAAAGISVTASITGGKLQFKSDLAGDYNISVNMDNSDFGRVVGIGSQNTGSGTPSTVEKVAAKVTGGVTGLTNASQLVGSVDITLQGLKTRTTTGVNTEGGANNTASSIKTITLSGTIGDAIAAINAQTNATQIRAYLDAQGRFVLEQTNQNTENEFDTISFSVSGTGDFGAITGLSTYITYGQDNAGSTTGQSYSYITGITDNLKGTEQITSGVATITFKDSVSSWATPVERTFNVNISGTVEQAAQQINDKAAELGYSLYAYIDSATGRFTIKSTSYGPDEIGITVQNSDFARITGIANYTLDYATVTSGSSQYDMHPIFTGGQEVNADINSISGTLVIGGNTISTVNKTLGQIVEEVNNLGLAGVTADLDTGYFRIKMLESSVASPYSISATGDFARLTGFGDYSVGSASYVDGFYTVSDGTPSYITKSAMGLSSGITFVGGKITIEHDNGHGSNVSFSVNTAGKTISQVVAEINSLGQSGASVNSVDGYSLNYVYASFDAATGQISIKTNENSHTITATGDFARITGFSEYHSAPSSNVGATTTTQHGTMEYVSKNNSVLSETTTFTSGTIRIEFEKGASGWSSIGLNATGLTVSEVVAQLQNQANSISPEYSVDGYVTNRPEIYFDSATGKIVVKTYGDVHDVIATGNVAELTGFYSGGDYEYSQDFTKDIVTYNKNGTLTGGVKVSDVSNGNALYGQAGTLDFYSGATKIGSITVAAGDTLNTVLNKISNMTVNYDPPAEYTNLNWDNSITASIVGGKVQLKYGAGIEELTVSGTSSFAYFYGLSSTETVFQERSTAYDVKNSDVYVYSNGSITGSVDVKDMISTGSLTVGNTQVGPFYGQRNGLLTFVSDITGETLAVGNVEILETDTLDDVMRKINNMTTVDAVTPDGVEINKINGFTASFTSDGKIQITYGGQEGAVRIQDTSGFSQYYGLTDDTDSWTRNYAVTQEERPYPDRVGQSVVTGSTIGYTESSVVGGLKSGILSASINGKTVNINYVNTESISVIMSRLVDAANKVNGEGLFEYNGDLDLNINPLTEDRFSYSINANGQIVITSGVESRTGDQLVISDISGNFAKLTGIATAPEGYTAPAGAGSPPATPGVSVHGTSYYITRYSSLGDHGSFSYTGASISGLTGDTALTGLTNGGFNISTTAGTKWIAVNQGDTVNQVLAKINALNSSIHATFDEENHLIRITSTDNALTEFVVSGDTSGFTQRVGLGLISQTTAANFTNTQESFGHAKIWGSVDILHNDHILGNMQGGTNSATETVTISSGAGSVNITVKDDEKISDIITKINNTGKYSAGITDGKFWIKSLTDSSTPITVSDSNFARIVGLNSGNELLGDGTLTTGSYGTFSYTGAAIAGLMGSSNLTIDSSLVGAGDGTIQVTLADKTSNTISVASKSFNVDVSSDMTVDQIMTAIKTAAVNAGVTGFDIYFDSSTHKVMVSVSGNQAEQITFSGVNTKGTDLVKRLGLATTNNTVTNNGTNVKETDGVSRLTGSVKDLHGSHVMGNLTTQTFKISGPNGDANITVTNGETLSQIITNISTQSGGRYIANIDAEGRFIIQSANQSSSAISVTSTDFTKRVGLVSSNNTEGSNSISNGSFGNFVFRGEGGFGHTGIDGMRGTTVFAGLHNGSFKFTLGETSIITPEGKRIYHAATTYTVNVTAGQSVQTILNNMKSAITAGGGVSDGDIDFKVEVDATTGKGRIYLKMSGKDASQITFSNDTTGFITMAGLSETGATTPANYTAVNRSYGKAIITGSMTGLSTAHVFGNMTAGTMVITAGAVTKTVNIAAGDSIQQIATKIAQGGLFTAGVDENGKFYIKTAAENASNITISGTSDFYKLVGLNAGSWNATSTQVNGSYGYSKITGSASGLTANQKFNNMTSGTFTISAAGLRTLTVTVSAGTTKISDVINYINNTATSDYQAALNANGQLVINTKVANGATVIVRDGTSNYAQIMGLTAGQINNASISNTGRNDEYSTLTGATTGLSDTAKFSAGDFTIYVKKPDNTVVSQKFTLTGTESLNTIRGNITGNATLGIKAEIDSVTGQLVLTSKTSGAYEISIVDGTSNFAEATGLTKNNDQIQPAQLGTLATLTSSKTQDSANLLGYSTGTFFVSLTNNLGVITNTQKITIASGDTINDIVDKINDSGIGIRAEIDAITGKMVLTRSSSTTGGGLSVQKGTSDFTNKIGFTSNGLQSESVIIEGGTASSKAVLTGSVLSTTDGTTRLNALGITGGTFRINNKVITISESETINNLVQKINNAFTASDPNGVRASFTGGKLILTANIAADNSRIKVEAGSSNVTSVVGFTNGVTQNNSAQEIGLNAKYTLNGIDYENRSNIIALDGSGNIVAADSADESIRLTVQEIGNGVLDVGKRSVDETYSKLVIFATKFNSAMALSQNAVLAGDMGFVGLFSSIKAALINDVGSIQKVENKLAEIGINLYSTTTSTGAPKVTMAINRDKFVEAMMNDTSKVTDLLIGNDAEPIDMTTAGSFTRVKTVLDEALHPISGYMQSTKRVIDAQKRALEKELTTANGDLAKLKSELAANVDDSEAAKNKEELEKFLENILEQYKTINELITKLNRQYTQSLSVMVVNKNNPTFS